MGCIGISFAEPPVSGLDEQSTRRSQNNCDRACVDSVCGGTFFELSAVRVLNFRLSQVFG